MAIIDNIKTKVEEIKKQFSKDLKSLENEKNDLEKYIQDIKVKYLGKKSEIQNIMKEMGKLSNEEKPVFGKIINELKQFLKDSIDDKNKEIEEKVFIKKVSQEKIDITEPVEIQKGSLHPINLIIDEIVSICEKMGYVVMDGPEIEKTQFVFDMLNTPKDHPARDIQDTFYINDEIVLRSHTSSVQIRTMLEENVPLKIICPGKVYRSDSVDATHSPVFNQLEGLVIGENITMSDLKGTLSEILKKLLGDDIKLRFRPHYFAYTEPSAEVDVSCFACKGKGCSVCKNEGWIELLGCGMVHPDVLDGAGIDSNKYSGFAFGVGIERIAMAKYGVDDIRLFYENDKRFLEQF